MDENTPERPASDEEVAARQSETSLQEDNATSEPTAINEAAKTELNTSETDGTKPAARYRTAQEREMEKLEKQMEDRTKIDTKKKKWKTALKVIFIVALIGASIYLMFGLSDEIHGEGTLGFSEMLRTTFQWKYFLIFLAVIVTHLTFESLKYAYLLKVSTGKWRLRNAISVMFLGKYYDNVTPLGTGGQPFQIYYLHKKKVPAGAATAVPLVKYIITTYVFGIMSAVFLGLAPGHFAANPAVSSALTTTFLIVAWVGVSVHLLVPTTMLLLSSFPKAGKKIIAWIVKVLHKMRIVKHKYTVTKKYVNEVAEYRNALKLFLKKWYKLIPLLLITCVEAFLHISMPFFAVLAIAGSLEAVVPSAELLYQIMCLSAVAFYSATLIPTPGNVGAMDMSSSFVFTTLPIPSVAGWAVLAWRFTSFYLFIIVGVCMLLTTTIRDAIRSKRARKQQN